MGIQGLLKSLHPLLVPPPSHPCHQQGKRDKNTPRHNIRQFANKSLAVDASSWLFKAGYTCADRLVEAMENNTRDPIAEKAYTNYIIKRCKELLNHAQIATIYLVFDGIRVPLKSGTNADREQKRKSNLEEARRLMAMGRKEEARDKYKSCVKGTSEMAQVVARAVQKEWGKYGNARVKYVFSPYEADSQLVKLCVDGLTHAVVTEDSDVLVYSAVCRMPFPIIYKLNPKDGSCDVITMDWLVNPEMLSSSVQSRRRRRQRDWSDSPMKKSDHSDTFLLDENNSAQQSSPEEKHVSEVDYDDMGFAPIRRQLPPISGGKSGTASGGRSNGDGGGSGAAMLSSLRAFANKEALHPGSGVRLFVQSCVLAGCDYIPNRLSKVGPVTAFKLVKETSHRDPGVRFQRVLKSLPKGSRLLAEAISDKRSEDGDVDDDELEDDFSSPPCSDSEAKEKYEELLSKSEAIFYYHLVQTICDGKIVPLVSHKPTDLRSSDAKSLPSDFFPCTKRFDPGLPFVGSIEEALKKLSETELSIVENSSFVPARQGNNGWMSTTSRKRPVANVYKKPPIQKETRLQSFLKAPSVRPKALFQNVSNNAMADIVKNVSSTNMIDKPISDRFIVKRKSPSRTPAHSTKHIAEKKKEWNPFAAFVRVATEADQNISKPMQSPDFANHAARKSAGKGMTSPLFSPGQSTDMFDYGDTPTNAEGTFKSRHFTGVDRSELQRDSESAKMDDESPVRDSSNSRSNDVQKMLKEIDIEKKKAEGRQHVSKESDLASGIEDSKFDYEIIPESPPLKSSSKGKAVASKYFQQLKSAHALPQRISTSPPEHFREMARNDEMAGGSSPHDAIELLEDGEAEVMSATKENYPNCKQPKNLVPKTSSVNKRPFISPYFNSNKNNQSGTGLRKKLRTTASSAILAGFARQKEIETSVTSSAWKKSSLSKCAGIATRKKPLPVAKRPKGTPSMMDFMMPSDIKNIEDKGT